MKDVKIDIENATVSWSEKDTVAYGNDFGGGVLFALDYLTEKAKEEQQWIPVTERLPEDDETLHFYDDGRLRACTVLTYQKINGVQISNRLLIRPTGNEYLDKQATNGWEWSFGTRTVTHWMPLPTPPKDGE